MTQKEQTPKPADQAEQADEFERFLQQQPLGPPTEHGSELLYQCGYAAGMVAAQRQAHSSIQRWRLVGLAAASIACLALGLNAYPTAQTPPVVETVAQANSASSETPATSSETSTSNGSPQPVGSRDMERRWNRLLTQQRPDDPSQATTPRPSTWTPPLPEIPARVQGSVPAAPAANQKILQPNDYHLLMQGDV